MFRGRHNNESLPTTMNGNRPFQQGQSNHHQGLLGRLHFHADPTDGSAASIHITPPVVKAWRQSSVWVKRAYQFAFVCVVLLYMGYRMIRYNNAYIHLTCHSTECFIRIQPRGWSKVTEMSFARDQLVDARYIKERHDGAFVTDQGVRIDDYHYEGGDTAASSSNQKYNKKKKKKNKKSTNSSYKGPDEDGNYLSYGLYLKDRTPENIQPSPPEADADPNNSESEMVIPHVSLKPLSKFLMAIPEDPTGAHYRLSLRLSGSIPQSRRRVRTIVTKVTSYIKKRRQKLVLKENSVPSWQGIVLVVGGLVGCLISILLAQIWQEDDEIARAKQGHGSRKHKGSGGVRRPTQSTTPNKQGSSSSTTATATTTAASSRFGTAMNHHQQYPTTRKRMNNSTSGNSY